MSTQILTDYDFVKASKILNVMVDPRASDDTGLVSGQMWYNTSASRFKGYDGANAFVVPRVDSTETVSDVWTFNPGLGSVPFIVDASVNGIVTNLNADLLDGYHAATSATADTIALRGGAGALIVATPTLDGHAATKAYVDAVAAGNDWKDSCLVATTSVLPTYTHSAGVLTATTNGAIGAIDGTTLVLNDRILVKNETSTNEPFNGIYKVTVVGDISTPWELTRDSDANDSAEVSSGLTTYIEGGTTNAGAGYTLTTADPITLGTTNLAFSQTSGSSIFTAGNGLVKSGSAFHFAQAGSFSIGQIPYASGTTTIGFINPASAGNVLKANGAAIPIWGKVDMTADITGVTPVANGGSGTSTQFTQGSVVFAGASGVYSQDATKLFWNEALDRLGVGTNSPNNELTVSGNADITGSLGIGVSSPSVKLEIKTATDEMLWLNSSSATGNPELVLLQDSIERASMSFDDSLDMLKLNSPYGGVAFFAGAAGTSSRKASISSTGYFSIGRATTSTVPIFATGPDGEAGTGYHSDSVAVFNNAGSVSASSFTYITAGASGRSVVWLGDTDDISKAAIDYDHAGDRFMFRSNGTTVRLSIESTGYVKVASFATATGNSVVLENSGVLEKRTIDSRVWGSSLVDGSGTANTIPKWSDTNTLTTSGISDDSTTVEVTDRVFAINRTTGDPNLTLERSGTVYSQISQATANHLALDSKYGGITFATGSAGTSAQVAFLDSSSQMIVGGNETTAHARMHLIGPDGHSGLGTFSADALFIADNAGSTGAHSFIYCVGGSAARAGIFFGDEFDVEKAAIDYDNAIDALQFRSNGTTVRMLVNSSGYLQINAFATATGNSVVLENSGVLEKRTIDSRVWGSSLVDGSGTTERLSKFSDSNTLTDSQFGESGTHTMVLYDRHFDMQNANRIIKGGFGALSTGGTLDYNDATNSSSGNGETLLQATHTNGPGNIDGTEFFHEFNFEYSTKNGTGNRTQILIPYNKDRFYFRRYFSSVWSDWKLIWNEGYQGAGTGMDSDLLDGQEGSYYLDLANSTGDSDDITEGATNLYYTDARARGSLSSAASTQIAYDSVTGVIGLGTEAARIKSGTIGDGAATTIGFTHNLGTRDVIVQVFRTGTPYDTVIADVTRNTTNQVTLEFNAAPTSAEFTVVVIAAQG